MMQTNTMRSLDYCCLRVQTQLLGLSLQLAEKEDKPKRAGDFSSTYKTATGAEITVKRSPDGKFANKGGGSVVVNESSLPLITPETDSELRKTLLDVGNKTLQDSLIDEKLQPPGVIEGIKNTNIEDVIKGGKDAFSNAVIFMRDKTKEAATVVSENKKEVAIGAAIVGFAVASAGASAIFNGVAIRTALTIVLGLLRGSALPEALMLGVKTVTPEKVKALISGKIYALAITYRMGITAHQEIAKQVESVKLARNKKGKLS